MALSYISPTRNLPDGYTFRGATLNDINPVVHLLNQRQMADIGIASFHMDDLRQEWQWASFNPRMDIRLVFDRSEHLIGYIEVWMLDNQPRIWGCVHPAFEGRGIGTALLRWGEARVLLALDNLPQERWVAPHFSTLPVIRAQELCAALGWHRVRTDVAETRKVTGTLHLPENTNLQYAVYEKEITL